MGGADRRGGLDRIGTGLVVAGLPYEAVDQLVGRAEAAALDQLVGREVAATPVVARGLALVSDALGVADP